MPTPTPRREDGSPTHWDRYLEILARRGGLIHKTGHLRRWLQRVLRNRLFLKDHPAIS